MKIKYLEKGKPYDFKRVDTIKEINCVNKWESDGLTYVRINQFNVISIATEDIISITN